MTHSRPPAGRLEILDGGRAGSRFSLDPERASVVGRSPRVTLPLDAEVDLDVSREHARLQVRQGVWTLEDLGSRNGTFLNGERVGGPVPLADGDELRFGAEGPRARFRLGASNTARLRQQGRQRTLFLVGSATLLILMAGFAAFWMVRGERVERTRWLEERAALESRVDSLLARDARAEGALGELGSSLDDSRREVARLREALDQQDAGDGRDRSEEVTTLRRDLETATQALARQQLAASLDFDAIEANNRSAVVMVFSETADGRVVTGTGFVVTPDAVVVTSRHLLEDASGQLNPARLAVQFADSRQVWPAEVLEVAAGDDLALLRAGPISGDVPMVYGLRAPGRAIQTGLPVAVLGFPLGGGETLSDGPEDGRPPADPLLTAGVVSQVSRRELLIQGYGEPGASGSPVLDGDGRVVGIIQGGERTARGGVLVVVPVARLVELARLANVPLP